MNILLWIKNVFLAYLADDLWTGTHVQAIVDEPGLLARLMANLKRMNERRLVSGCLRCLGNVITGNDQQTVAVLNLGVLPELVRFYGRNLSVVLQLRLLTTGWPQIKREAAWTLSNVAAGPAEQIDQLLSVDSMLSQLLHVARHAELRTRKVNSYPSLLSL